jgi:hypothetical protein
MGRLSRGASPGGGRPSGRSGGTGPPSSTCGLGPTMGALSTHGKAHRGAQATTGGDGDQAGAAFPLSSSDGNEAINGLETGLHGFVNGFSGDNSRGLDFNSVSLGGFHGSLSVNGVTEGVEGSSEHFFSDGHIHDGSGSSDDISFLDVSIVT